MEFDDINRNPRRRETSFYENTSITSATTSNHGKMENDEERYESLKRERNVKKIEPNFREDTLKRIKVFGSIFFALLIVLYIAVIALVVVITLSKEQDGGWSPWGNWGSCTESCGGGVRTRSRSCTNPSPSLTGRSCAGNNTDVSTCNRTTCPEHNVAFTAYNIYKNSSSYTTLLFQNTHINNGNAYDTTTGKFTCNAPGVYHFVVTLTKYNQDINYVHATLRINGSDMLRLYSNEVRVYMLTGAGTFHLNRNDVVDVSGVPNYFFNDYYSYFTGFLITPDQ